MWYRFQLEAWIGYQALGHPYALGVAIKKKKILWVLSKTYPLILLLPLTSWLVVFILDTFFFSCIITNLWAVIYWWYPVICLNIWLIPELQSQILSFAFHIFLHLSSQHMTLMMHDFPLPLPYWFLLGYCLSLLVMLENEVISNSSMSFPTRKN